MREPFEPLTITTSPARRAVSDRRLERGRVLGLAAAASPAAAASKSARVSGPAAKTQIDAVRAEVGRERGVQRRAVGPELQHVAEHRDAPALRPASPAPSSSSAARIEAGIGVVALVDEQDGARRPASSSAIARAASLRGAKSASAAPRGGEIGADARDAASSTAAR